GDLSGHPSGRLAYLARAAATPATFPAGNPPQLGLRPQALSRSRIFFSSTGWLLLSSKRIASWLEEICEKDVAMAHAGFRCRFAAIPIAFVDVLASIRR